MLVLAKRLMNDAALAEDVVQESLISAVKGLQAFEDRSSLKTWLHRITVNTAISKLRKQKRLAEQSIDDFHSFFPMELIATYDEIKEYTSANPASYYLFPEYRHFPIRMRKDLPFRWMGEEANGLKDKALKGEYYTFQCGIYSQDHWKRHCKWPITYSAP